MKPHPTQPLHTRRPNPALSRNTQRGLTLVELMVAMALSLVIALAAIAALTVARRGFTTVDAASQLRDNGRFATDIIQRLGVQAGYEEVRWAFTERKDELATINPDPFVFGLNNSTRKSSGTADEGNPRTSSTSAGYGSDLLVLRYQASETFPGSGQPDNSMINCGGDTATTIPENRNDHMYSVLHVAENQGELSLMCSTSTKSSFASSTPDVTQPLVRGVENFQVLYGVDGSAAASPTNADRFMRADEINALTNPNATWRRVRSIRIGMVLRGPAGSSQDNNTQTFYPFGPGKASATGAIGSALSSASDAGTVFTPTPDGRLRQALTFTIHLRNYQDL